MSNTRSLTQIIMKRIKLIDAQAKAGHVSEELLRTFANDKA